VVFSWHDSLSWQSDLDLVLGREKWDLSKKPTGHTSLLASISPAEACSPNSIPLKQSGVNIASRPGNQAHEYPFHWCSVWPPKPPLSVPLSALEPTYHTDLTVSAWHRNHRQQLPSSPPFSCRLDVLSLPLPLLSRQTRQSCPILHPTLHHCSHLFQFPLPCLAPLGLVESRHLPGHSGP